MHDLFQGILVAVVWSDLKQRNYELNGVSSDLGFISPSARYTRTVLNVACNVLCCSSACGVYCSETSTIKQHTQGNNPKDYTQPTRTT